MPLFMPVPPGLAAGIIVAVLAAVAGAAGVAA